MAPTMAPKARPHLARMLAERKKMHLTRGDNGALGGIRTPNLLIRRSIRRVRDGPPWFLLGGRLCVMILVDGLIVDRVAVSVAVNSSIMQTRVDDHRTASVRGRSVARTARRSSYRTKDGNAGRASSRPPTSQAEGQGVSRRTPRPSA
jgi:hypothetical protein